MELSVSAVERIVSYNFKNKKLLEDALTHSSYTDSASYERLEFLGDAAINLAISVYFFRAYPLYGPGQLSSLRAVSVSTEKLARVAVRHGFFQYVRHNAAGLDETVKEFSDSVSLEYGLVAYSSLVKAPKVLADIVESVAGAIYVDVDFDLRRLWVIFRGLLEPIVTPEELQPQPVTFLFHVCQKHHKQVDIINWNDGSKNVASVYVDGSFITSCSAMQKEIARLNAARDALIKLSESIPMSIDGFGEFFEIEGEKQKLHELCHRKKRLKPNYSPLAIENVVSYNFKDKKLLVEALTHSSFSHSSSYERLEFIGDAAFSLTISNYFFLAYPLLDPGQLSLYRAKNISTEKFARVAVRHGLFQYVRHNVAALDAKVEKFTETVSLEDGSVSYGDSVKAPKVLADIVESVAGAIFVDVNFDLQRLWVIIRGLLEPIFTPEDLQGEPQPVALLFEVCQKRKKQVDIISWRNGSKSVASVYVDGSFIVSSSAMQKEIARLNAARHALIKLLEHVDTNVHVPASIDGPCVIERAKQKLHEFCNKLKWPKPKYRTEKELGPSNGKRYVRSVKITTSLGVLVMIGDVKPRIKDADNSAASLMIHALQERNYL